MGGRSRLLEVQGSEEHFLVFQQQSGPSCGGYGPKSLDQMRQRETRVVSYQEGERSSGTSKKGSPESEGGATKILDYLIRDRALPIRKENHNWRPKFQETSKTKQPQRKPDLGYEPLRAPILHHDGLSCAESCRKVCSTEGLMRQHNI